MFKRTLPFRYFPGSGRSNAAGRCIEPAERGCHHIITSPFFLVYGPVFGYPRQNKKWQKNHRIGLVCFFEEEESGSEAKN
ncbi:MAG: hypothetical protein ACLQAH_00300 [Limisphaerales bacterium]